jgi:hypothetical protein
MVFGFPAFKAAPALKSISAISAVFARQSAE